jgi:hypothetical protein
VVDADEMMLIKVKMLATKSISGRCCLETFEGSWNSWSHGALRLPDPAYCRDLEREVYHRWTVLVKVYTPRWDRHVGNERLLVGVLLRFEWLECC